MIGPTAELVEFGALLRHFRDRARLTQKELASLSTVSARTIRNLEAGWVTNPRSTTIRLLAQGLRLSPQSQTQLSAAAGKSELGAALEASQGQLPSWDLTLERHPLGREQDLRSVLDCVRGGTTGPVTVSGFGGVGKTQLAAALAPQVEKMLHARWLWIRLDGTTEILAASPTEAAFLQWCHDLADGAADAVEELAHAVGDSHFLIVLDGVDCPSRPFESRLRDLMRRCPRLVVIETARCPLQREGRHVVPLMPLRLPDADEALDGPAIDQPAVRLMMPLIRAVQPEFDESEDNVDHVLDVCRSLDGIPRALKAAAPWFAFYPPALVAEAARDNPQALASSDTDEAGPGWLQEAADLALRALTDDQRGLLSELVRRDTAWSADDLVGPGGSLGSVVALLRPLLVLGVIRPVHESGARTYTVLNVLRDLV